MGSPSGRSHSLRVFVEAISATSLSPVIHPIDSLFAMLICNLLLTVHITKAYQKQTIFSDCRKIAEKDSMGSSERSYDA